MTEIERLARKPSWLLSRAHARASALLADAFAAAGVRGHHYRLLAALEQFGPASQADLGRLTGIDASDVVAAVGHLVDQGLAVRTPDAVDRRRNSISLTARGASALGRLDTVVDEVQDALLAPLTPKERVTLARLLAKVG